MLRLVRSPAFQRQLLACGISTSRTLLMAMQTVKPPLTSLNGAATTAKLDLEGTLEEVASSHFSESSAFPEFSPMEDTLLSEAVPRIKPRTSSMASLNGAAKKAQLNIEGTLEDAAVSHFSESSAFPEFTPMEDTLLSEAIPRIKAKTPSMTSLNGAAKKAELNLEGTLEDVAASHFSESSAFPEFSPAEDTLLSEAVPRIKPKASTMTSLNGAAKSAQLELDGTLEEVASSHFSESSAFPEFSPMEDTLLSQTVPRTKTKAPIADAHSMAQEDLTEEMQQHFCTSSDFPEYSAAEEEAMMHKV
jgi:nucleoid-associated protein YejK